jgi:hypothetical protein
MMAEKRQDVRFIRKGGRIIPIRAQKKEPSKEKLAAQAVGLGAAGVATSAFAGSTFAEFGKEAQFKREAAKGLFKRGRELRKSAEAVRKGSKIPEKRFDFLVSQARTFTRAGAFHRARARSLGKVGFKIGAASLVGGAFLLDYAASKLHKTVGIKEGEVKNLVFQTATALPVFIGSLEYGKKRGLAKGIATGAFNTLLKRRRL